MLKKTQLAAIEATTAAVKEIAIPMPVTEKAKSKDKVAGKKQLSLIDKFLHFFPSKDSKLKSEIKYIPSNPLMQHDFLNELSPYLGVAGLLQLMQVNKDLLKLIMVTNAKRNMITLNLPTIDLNEKTLFVKARQMLIRRQQVINALDNLIENINTAIRNVADMKETHDTCCGLSCTCKCDVYSIKEPVNRFCYDPTTTCGIFSIGVGCLTYIGILVWLAVFAATLPNGEITNDTKICGTEVEPQRANCTVENDYVIAAELWAPLGLLSIPMVFIILFWTLGCCWKVCENLCHSLTDDVFDCTAKLIECMEKATVSENKAITVRKNYGKDFSASFQAISTAIKEYQSYLDASIDKLPAVERAISPLNTNQSSVKSFRINLKVLQDKVVILRNTLQPGHQSSLFKSTQKGPHTFIKMFKGTDKKFDFTSNVAEKIARKL